MNRLLKYFSIFACLVVTLSSCDDDDLLSEYDTHKDEYTVYYNVTYSTTYDFHDIAYITIMKIINIPVCQLRLIEALTEQKKQMTEYDTELTEADLTIRLYLNFRIWHRAEIRIIIMYAARLQHIILIL